MKFASTVLAILMLGVLTLPAQAQTDFRTISPKGHQAIKAKIINPEPKTFTINVRMFANLGVNEDAPTFAMYISSSLPKECADLRSMKLTYTKPEKYYRRFDLSTKKQVLEALDKYKCVVITNRKPTDT